MKKWTVFICGVVVATAMYVQAAVVVQETWPDNTQGWVVSGNSEETDAYDGTPSWAAFLGGQPGVLQISASTGGGVSRDYITDAGGSVDLAFSRDFVAESITAVSTKFYSMPGGVYSTPSALSLYFLHDEDDPGADDFIWYYNINPATLNSGWNDLSSALAWTGGGAGFNSWYTVYGNNTAGGFAAALADVDEIGIFITYQANLAGQLYGLDDFQLYAQVPEPGTYSMLGFAMLSLVVTFRRKLSSAWAGLRRS